MTMILKHFASSDLLTDRVKELTHVVTRVCSDEPALIEAMKEGCDVLLADGSVPLGSHFFESSGRLRRVIYFDIGLIDRVDVAAATRCGVVITLPRTRSQNAVAEHTLMLLLALLRHLDLALAVGRAGDWPTGKGTLEHLRGSELYGCVLGIVGWSRIGKLMAEKASALGMQVLVHSPRADPREVPHPLLGLQELLEKADVVSLHTRLGPMNHRLIGERELSSMKPTAYLINTARGALIDEVALVRALKEGWIAGVALDVLEKEPPPPDHPLLHLQNALITPHIAWNTSEVRTLEMEDLEEELRRAVVDEAPLNCANPEVLGSKRR